MKWENQLASIPPPPNISGGGGGLSVSECLELYLYEAPVNVHHGTYDVVHKSSEEWQKLKEINKFDLNLYWFAKDLFDGEQLKMYNKIKMVND